MKCNGSVHSAKFARVGIKASRGILNVETDTEMGGFIRAAGNIDVEIGSEKNKIPVSIYYCFKLFYGQFCLRPKAAPNSL
jgi:hypothetical protein